MEHLPNPQQRRPMTTSDAIRALQIVEKGLESRQRHMDVTFQLEGVRHAIQKLEELEI